MKAVENKFSDYTITTDKNKMDIVAIHDFLSNHSGWSNKIINDTEKKYPKEFIIDYVKGYC